MPSIPSSGEIAALTGLLAPGIVILWVRSRFKDVTPPAISDKVTSYAIISVAYNALSYPLFHADGWLTLPSWLWQFAQYVLLPLLIGVALVFFDQSERFYKLTEKMGLRPVHHTPTAWDFTFRKREPAFVLVHLTDGSEVAGAWTGGSFASSMSGDRDIYVDQMWTVQDGGWQSIDPPRSILICGGTIRMIEFISGGKHE